MISHMLYKLHPAQEHVCNVANPYLPLGRHRARRKSNEWNEERHQAGSRVSCHTMAREEGE